MTDKQKELLKEVISEEKIYFDESMKKHTTFKIGGPAECLIKITKEKELKEILNFANKQNIEITVLGNGSNVLVSDNGIKGITLKIEMNELEVQQINKDVFIRVGAGCKISAIAYKFLEKEIEGLEFASGIPATVGGAIRMNAGAHGKEMKDIVESVIAIDLKGNKKEFSKEEAKFAYRTSIFADGKYIIINATMRLKKGHKEEIKEKMDEYLNFRKLNQPLEYPSVGSTFKRGEDFIAAKLIDECGLKGYTIGGATVSTKHAGFVINKGNATAKDVLELVKYVKEEVNRKFNKQINLEMILLGEF